MGLLDGFLSGSGGLGGLGGVFGGAGNSLGISKTGIPALDNAITAMDERAKRPKPGKFCPSTCQLVGEEHCGVCLEQQAKLEEKLLSLERLDAAINAPQPQTPAKPKPVKCSLCGAPIENGLRECPYCTTPYPAFDDSVDTSDLPQSNLERDRLYVTSAVETYAMYAEIRQETGKLAAEQFQNKFPKALQGILGTITTPISAAFGPMSAEQIRQGAQQYGVSYYEYVLGTINGAYESRQFVQVQERVQAENKRIEEQNAAQQEYFARNRQIEQERQAKIRAIRKEQNDRMIADAKNHVAHYGGYSGGSSCCGNCRYYMVATNECANNKYMHPSGASDSCINWCS